MNLVLDETALRAMPSALRKELLDWYFDWNTKGEDSHSEALTDQRLSSQTSPVPKREERGRISFQQFMDAGLLKAGDRILCKSLGRQRRKGIGGHFDAGKVLRDGKVEYQGRIYEVPSKLAIAVLNDNGGNSKAVNGYDYLFVHSHDGDHFLADLRKELD